MCAPSDVEFHPTVYFQGKWSFRTIDTRCTRLRTQCTPCKWFWPSKRCRNPILGATNASPRIASVASKPPSGCTVSCVSFRQSVRDASHGVIIGWRNRKITLSRQLLCRPFEIAWLVPMGRWLYPGFVCSLEQTPLQGQFSEILRKTKVFSAQKQALRMTDRCPGIVLHVFHVLFAKFIFLILKNSDFHANFRVVVARFSFSVFGWFACARNGIDEEDETSKAQFGWCRGMCFVDWMNSNENFFCCEIIILYYSRSSTAGAADGTFGVLQWCSEECGGRARREIDVCVAFVENNFERIVEKTTNRFITKHSKYWASDSLLTTLVMPQMSHSFSSAAQKHSKWLIMAVHSTVKCFLKMNFLKPQANM